MKRLRAENAQPRMERDVLKRSVVLIDLDTCWRAYLRRFDIEHTFRFCKNTLGWTTPRLCTPHQADRWTWLIAAAYTQLRLTRPLVADQRLP